MPQHKMKRKEKYSSNKAELSLLVYLPYLFMITIKFIERREKIKQIEIKVRERREEMKEIK